MTDDQDQDFVTVKMCDRHHKMARNQIIFLMGFLAIVMTGIVWAVNAAYAIERRFNVHEAVQEKQEAAFKEDLEEIKDLIKDLKKPSSP